MSRRACAAMAAVVMAVVLSAGGRAWAQAKSAPPAGIPDAAAYRDGVMKNGNLRTQGTGEGFCWHAASGADLFLDAYEAYGEAKWLAEAEKYYDFFLGKLQKDPDGYEGWIGDPISEHGAELCTDAVVGDAILCEPLARFAEIVLKDDKLKAQFGKTAQRYLDLATRICWEKWNNRGCYYEDAAGWGSYHTYGKLVDLKANKWVDQSSRVISDNLNKHYAISTVILRLWRITGKPEYRERVIKVFGRAKTMWRYYPEEDRIVWNFWMPHGPYDISGRSPKSWVGVHPERSGYQSAEVRMFVEAYDSGLVFEQADLEKMIRTNHWMHEGEAWRNADGTTKAGTLWTALARFDEPIRKEAEAEWAKGGTQGAVELACLKSVMAKAPGWKRLYVTDDSKVQVVKVPLQPGKTLTMTVVIPDAVEVAANSRVQCATQTRAAGKLKIELLDAAGKEGLGKIAEIETGKDGEFNAPFWDGTNPKTGKKDLGEYRIRWTLNDEVRTAPVFVKQGTARKIEGPEPLKPGETFAADFEAALDQRWKVENAAVSMEQAHGGKSSLKVAGHAELVLSATGDLPLRVKMWVFDDGGKAGKAAKNGSSWGVSWAGGDKFCLWHAWRTYLDGDGSYAWVNTGENGWFSPHPSGVPRKAGWVEWVLDFSDANKVSITGDGKAIRGLSAKLTPTGVASVIFAGASGSPLYVDDITAEYPKK